MTCQKGHDKPAGVKCAACVRALRQEQKLHPPPSHFPAPAAALQPRALILLAEMVGEIYLATGHEVEKKDLAPALQNLKAHQGVLYTLPVGPLIQEVFLLSGVSIYPKSSRFTVRAILLGLAAAVRALDEEARIVRHVQAHATEGLEYDTQFVHGVRTRAIVRNLW